ncbi:response regulator transcription factor [Cohnella caldifontis]|uniref:response regulator transcription factor n=1 Tax=Cohnella caldifontis TaxID=3027471 RepID=UPI0023EC5158|nr:helix-turn-helix domain-containing protein [Cohnella sp. YIM B05605]
MIKAVVVDDEKLVRKGFISLFDWSSYGMVVVGEAGDGKTALEVLRQTNADLLFTDITMPGMSGFDLIKETRIRHPRVRSVVLTCHHEFDFVQEALRLGAIDYIVKTLLELDNADEVMRRIVERIEWEVGTRAAHLTGEAQKKIPADSALVFRPLVPAEGGSAELFELPFVRRNPVMPIGGMWLAPLLHSSPMEEIKREIKARLGGRWESAFVTGVSGLTAEEAEKEFADWLPREWFYSPAGDEPLWLAFGERVRADRAAGRQPSETFKDALDMKWALDAAGWEDFKRTIGGLRPDPELLRGFGESLCREWGGMLLPAAEAESLHAAIERNRTWADWQSWLLQYSDVVKRRLVELSFTAEVLLCLIRAVRYMRKHAGHKINQADVAARVNMSRGYFSQCFARLAGEPFGSVLRDMRIDRAKRLLRETADPVHQIALASGFEDEKYFSRLFRERVGMLPSEYRVTSARPGGTK